MGQLDNKRAIVTGGRKGIGRAIVDHFVAEGAEVLTCGRGPRPAELPKRINWLTIDIAQNNDIETIANWAREHWDHFDILVNNAGVQIEKTVTETTDADWDQLMGVNAKGVFMACRALIPVMNKGGSIINIGSISGKTADPGLALYNASKAFVHGLTRSIAVDHGPDIRCNAICPGWIMTEMADAAFELCADPAKGKADALARHPAGRFGKPDDIAKMAVWLGSDASSFATGQCYTLDGGLTAASPINTGLF